MFLSCFSSQSKIHVFVIYAASVFLIYFTFIRRERKTPLQEDSLN